MLAVKVFCCLRLDACPYCQSESFSGAPVCGAVLGAQEKQAIDASTSFCTKGGRSERALESRHAALLRAEQSREGERQGEMNGRKKDCAGTDAIPSSSSMAPKANKTNARSIALDGDEVKMKCTRATLALSLARGSRLRPTHCEKERVVQCLCRNGAKMVHCSNASPLDKHGARLLQRRVAQRT